MAPQQKRKRYESSSSSESESDGSSSSESDCSDVSDQSVDLGEVDIEDLLEKVDENRVAISAFIKSFNKKINRLLTEQTELSQSIFDIIKNDKEDGGKFNLEDEMMYEPQDIPVCHRCEQEKATGHLICCNCIHQIVEPHDNKNSNSDSE
jgi:hypothetical protein